MLCLRCPARKDPRRARTIMAEATAASDTSMNLTLTTWSGAASSQVGSTAGTELPPPGSGWPLRTRVHTHRKAQRPQGRLACTPCGWAWAACVRRQWHETGRKAGAKWSVVRGGVWGRAHRWLKSLATSSLGRRGGGGGGGCSCCFCSLSASWYCCISSCRRMCHSAGPPSLSDASSTCGWRHALSALVDSHALRLRLQRAQDAASTG